MPKTGSSGLRIDGMGGCVSSNNKIVVVNRSERPGIDVDYIVGQSIVGVDGTAGELKVNFLDPAGSKTGRLFPTGEVKEMLSVPGYGEVEATILDVSNPIVLVRAEVLGLTGTELPPELLFNVLEPFGESGLGKIKLRCSSGKIARLRQCDQYTEIQFIHPRGLLPAPERLSGTQ